MRRAARDKDFGPIVRLRIALTGTQKKVEELEAELQQLRKNTCACVFDGEVCIEYCKYHGDEKIKQTRRDVNDVQRGKRLVLVDTSIPNDWATILRGIADEIEVHDMPKTWSDIPRHGADEIERLAKLNDAQHVRGQPYDTECPHVPSSWRTARVCKCGKIID